MERVVSDSLWELRLYRWLIGAFATLALVLAAIGLHGVVSYGATARLGSSPCAWRSDQSRATSRAW